MWYKTSVREELIEKILDKLPKSARIEEGVEEYARDYVNKLELGNVKLGDEKLVKRGIEEVYRKIGENKKK